MPTNPNMVAIQTVTVGSGGAASITFSNIPQTYTDLYIVASTRATDTDTPVKVEFNNVTTGYSWRRIYGSGSAASSLSGTDAYYFWTATSSQTASTFGSGQLYIPNYTSSNNKSISTESLNENNGTAADMFMTAALWSNSAAITSVKLTPLTGSFAQYSTATLFGVTSSAYGAKATGGIITSDANYFYHTFIASGTFTPTSNITADYLVVAGGGSAGSNAATDGSGGGGGGAGGYRHLTAQALTASTNYTVTIGGGGASNSAAGNGNAGSDSVFGSTTATGGGRGAGGSGSVNGGNGGSGGGAHGASGTGGTGNSPTTSPAQGTNGGNGNYSAPAYGSGGGGGSNGAGANGTSTGGGAGGAGTANSISGLSVTYAAGGNGGQDTGGGAIVQGTSGGANTGNGGSGGRVGSPSATVAVGGAGGSGIVIVRYSK